MLSEDFDQTEDTVYEVWNWTTEDDPLAGVFDDREQAGEFEMDQIIGTGGGRIRFYLPIERYTELPPDDRARRLLSEVLALVETFEDLPEYDATAIADPLDALDENLHPSEVDPEYDQEALQEIMNFVAWSDTAFDIARAYRTLARVRHLGVYDEKTLLTSELNLQALFIEVNESEAPE